MPQRKGETAQEWMARLRRHRADTMVERTRAAVGYINGVHAIGEGARMAAFLDIFHPDLPADQHLTLMHAARSQRRR